MSDERIDVLVAEMRAYGDRDSLPTSVVLHWANRLAAISVAAGGAAEARAALADLVAADTEYDEAWRAWRERPNSDRSIALKVRALRATERRTVALLRIGADA